MKHIFFKLIFLNHKNDICSNSDVVQQMEVILRRFTIYRTNSVSWVRFFLEHSKLFRCDNVCILHLNFVHQFSHLCLNICFICFVNEFCALNSLSSIENITAAFIFVGWDKCIVWCEANAIFNLLIRYWNRVLQPGLIISQLTITSIANFTFINFAPKNWKNVTVLMRITVVPCALCVGPTACRQRVRILFTHFCRTYIFFH